MFTVRVAVRVRPDGREKFVAQLEKQAHEVPMLFDGCQRFCVYCEPSHPESMFVYEEWASRQAAHSYLKSGYFNVARALLRELMVDDPDSAYYEAARVGP